MAYGSPAEQLTTNFYLWEQRGRGWQVWNFPVEPEPAFVQFSHICDLAPRYIDDGRKPTFLSNIVELFSKGQTSSARGEEMPQTDLEDLYSQEPSHFDVQEPIHEISISIPRDEEITVELTEHLLLSLSSCAFPLSFELLAHSEDISVQFACRGHDAAQVRHQLQAYFPNIGFETRQDTVQKLLLDGGGDILVVDFGLSEEFMRPLKTFKRFEPDPLIGIVGALENLEKCEVGMLQVLFQPSRHPWTGSIIRSVTDGAGGSFFVDSPDMVALAKEKIRSPLYAGVVRIIGKSRSKQRVWEIVKSLAGNLSQVADPLSNELIPLTNDEYDDTAHVQDVVLRQTHRTGMLLNIEELASLVHLPSASVQSRKLRRIAKHTEPPPAIVSGHTFVLGQNVHRGNQAMVSLSPEQRLRHIYVIGATGTGKSTLLLNLILQDIEQGEGVAVLDPHGDLIEQVLSHVPERRFSDVVLFDPSDAEYPVGLNILSARTEIEKNVLSSDLVAAFRRLSTSWGDQMTSVLGNAIQAFLESEVGGTLVDLRKFLLEPSYRSEFLKGVPDEDIRYFWSHQFPLLKGNTLASLVTRLDAFLRPKLIKNIVAQQEGLRVADILNSGKILLVKLAQGLIGEENASLLGTFIISKIHQAALSRQATQERERRHFYIYLDEFQNFLTPSMGGVLSGARKYRLGLTLAHQELRQLWNQDVELANSVISNPGTRICFRLGDFDAQKLADGFAHFDSSDLQNLGVGEAIVRVERKEYDFNLKTFTAPAVPDEEAQRNRERIIDLSRKTYGLPLETKPEPQEERPVVQGARVDTPIPTPHPKEHPKPKEVASPRKERPEISTTALPAPRHDVSHHRYLQTLIKKMAEQRGYRAVIEEPTPDGHGRVDVGLERNAKRLACEISVTTGDVQELHNVEKCLRAGYDPVIVCSPEKKNLEAIRKLFAEKLPPGDQGKVLFFEPEELFLFLDAQATQEVSRDELVKGYRVRVQYQAVSDAEKKKKREAVAQVIVQTLRKMKSA